MTGRDILNLEDKFIILNNLIELKKKINEIKNKFIFIKINIDKN